MELLRLESFVQATITKRPSRHIKSPYVADIIIDDTEYLGHTPSLGCCGLAEATSSVYVSELKGANTKCDYRINVANLSNCLVGIAPKMAEEITYNALKSNLIHGLNATTIVKEKKIMNSRFDFIGECDDKTKFILEVKNVPLTKTRDGKTYSYFPDGYRKKKTDTISERALKHVNELKNIKIAHPDMRCILLFVLQRCDSEWFEIYDEDPIYKDAVRDAWLNGVEIKTLQVKWDKHGICRYHSNTLPIILYDNCNLYL